MHPFPSGAEPNANQRRTGRVRCSRIQSSLGEVLDITAGGMRVAGRGSSGLREGEEVGLTIQFNEPLPLRCRVVWVRKTGWRRHEVGLKFVELSPQARATLAEVARGAMLQSNAA